VRRTRTRKRKRKRISLTVSSNSLQKTSIFQMTSTPYLRDPSVEQKSECPSSPVDNF